MAYFFPVARSMALYDGVGTSTRPRPNSHCLIVRPWGRASCDESLICLARLLGHQRWPKLVAGVDCCNDSHQVWSGLLLLMWALSFDCLNVDIIVKDDVVGMHVSSCLREATMHN
eukprot:scaffold12330_cov83-Skeletonema_marinoi.AAC.3